MNLLSKNDLSYALGIHYVNEGYNIDYYNLHIVAKKEGDIRIFLCISGKKKPLDMDSFMLFYENSLKESYKWGSYFIHCVCCLSGYEEEVKSFAHKIESICIVLIN